MDIDMGLSESSGKKRIRVRFYLQDLSNLSLKSYGFLYQVTYNYDENGNILEPYLNSDSKIEDADGSFIKKVQYDYNGTEILKKGYFNYIVNINAETYGIENSTAAFKPFMILIDKDNNEHIVYGKCYKRNFYNMKSDIDSTLKETDTIQEIQSTISSLNVIKKQINNAKTYTFTLNRSASNAYYTFLAYHKIGPDAAPRLYSVFLPVGESGDAKIDLLFGGTDNVGLTATFTDTNKLTFTSTETIYGGIYITG